MIRGIHHVALHTPDMGRLIRFYCDVVGFTVADPEFGGWSDSPEVDAIIDVRGSAAKTVMLSAGNVHLELFEFSSPPARGGDRLRPQDHGYTHICLDTDDIDADFLRLSAAGMTFAHPPVDVGISRAIYGKDPDGNIIELQQTRDHYPATLERLTGAKGLKTSNAA